MINDRKIKMEYLAFQKNKIKHFVGRYPIIFFPLYRFLSPKTHTENLLLRKGVEIVIEGFPRSANTFAVVAFNFAQGRKVPMAHHLHVEAQILRGVDIGLPVIVLIRHPVDAICSLMVRHPGSVQKYAKRYVEFYSAVLRVRERVVLAEFSEVTKNFGEIIRRVNMKFSTDFKIFESSMENVENVFKEIDEINNVIDGGKITHVARPVANRSDKQKASINQNEPHIQAAIRLYECLTTDAH